VDVVTDADQYFSVIHPVDSCRKIAKQDTITLLSERLKADEYSDSSARNDNRTIEIRSVERDICPIAESIMTDTDI